MRKWEARTWRLLRRFHEGNENPGPTHYLAQRTMSSASVVEPYSTATDSILVSSLRLNATVGNDRWAKTRPQPITLSLHLETSLADAGASDDVAHTIDYGQLTKALTSAVDGHTFGSLRELANAALHIPFDCPTAVAARIDVQAHNQFLRADALGVTLFRDKNNRRRDIDRMWMRGLKATCIIGVNPAEREWRQNVEVDVIFDDPGWIMPDWRGMHDKLIQVRESGLQPDGISLSHFL
jgi:FolB domain-containing protein